MYVGRENIYLVQTQQWTNKRRFFGPVHYYTAKGASFGHITAQFGTRFNNRTGDEPIETRIIAMKLLLTHKRRRDHRVVTTTIFEQPPAGLARL